MRDCISFVQSGVESLDAGRTPRKPIYNNPYWKKQK